ncbi:hypothetical protein ABFA07_000778 [Porites harrisoni]
MSSTAVISFFGIVLVFGSLKCNANKTDLYILQMVASFDKIPCKGMTLAYDVAKNSSSFKSFFEKYEIKMNCSLTLGIPGLAVLEMAKAFNIQETFPLIVLGPRTSKEASAVLQVVNVYRKLMITFLETTVKLEELVTDSFAFTFLPTAFSFNPPTIKFMNFFKWNRAAVVYDFLTDEGAKVKVVEDLATTASSNLTSPRVNLTFEPINPQQNLAEGGVFESIKNSLQSLRDRDYKIFIGEFADRAAALVFCQLYKMGMYGPEFVWILNPNAGTVDEWFEYTNRAIVQDKIKTEQTCNKTQYQKALNRAFTFKALMIREDDNFTTSSNLTVSEAFSRLGINDLSSDKTKNLATTSFDAMWGTMLAIKEASETKNVSDKLGKNTDFAENQEVSNFLVKKLTELNFQGLTGPVSFNPDKRRKDVIIVLQQYRDKEEKWVNVGEFSVNESGQLNLKFYEGMEETLWEDERVPSDRSQIIKQRMDTPRALFIIFSTVASFGIVLGIIFMVFNRYYRDCKFIRLSAPMFNDIIVLGCIMCLSTIYLFGIRKVNDGNRTMPRICKARAWLLNIGFSLAFGAMFIKTWRIYKICTNKRLKVRLGPLSDWWMLAMVFGIVVIDVVLLVAWELTDPLQHEEAVVDEKNDPADHFKIIMSTINTCTGKNVEMWLALIYVSKGILLLYGLFLAYETRNVVYAHLNDSRIIGICVYNVVVLSTIGAFLALILKNEQYVELYSALSVCISFPAAATISLIFIPKLIHCLKASSLDGETVGESTLNHTFSRSSIGVTSTFKGTEMGRERFVHAPPSGNTVGVYQNGGFMDSLSSIPSPSPAKSVEEPAHSATTLED